MTAAIVASLAVAVAASARPVAAGAASARPGSVELRRTSLGEVLVNSRGFTLYAFSRDSKGKDRCAATRGCTRVWPVAQTHGSPSAGRGVKRSQLGTIRLAGGARQLTYSGHPLYTYSGDSSPAQTDYVGVSQFGGIWRAVKASGRTVG